MSLRVGALFIILVTSAFGKETPLFHTCKFHIKYHSLGVFTPIIMHRISPYDKGSYRDWLLTMGKFCKFFFFTSIENM